MFQNSTKETKEFEKIILEIEKERDTISWAHTTIQSCLWNLENPKVERWVIDWCIRDLRAVSYTHLTLPTILLV